MGVHLFKNLVARKSAQNTLLGDIKPCIWVEFLHLCMKEQCETMLLLKANRTVLLLTQYPVLGLILWGTVATQCAMFWPKLLYFADGSVVTRPSERCAPDVLPCYMKFGACFINALSMDLCMYVWLSVRFVLKTHGGLKAWTDDTPHKALVPANGPLFVMASV